MTGGYIPQKFSSLWLEYALVRLTIVQKTYDVHLCPLTATNEV